MDELRALVDRVDRQKPDPADVKALRVYIDEHPGTWRKAGDLAEQANLRMIEVMQAPKAMKVALTAGLAELAADLEQPGDGALERLIIRQIVGCWLRLSYVEYMVNINTVEGNFNMTQGTYWDKRLSAAGRGYLRAIETLARVRRLRLPAVQVNIGAQQVNQVNAM